MREIKTITIVGVGLIGGSLGLAIKKKHIAKRVIGFGRNLRKLEFSKRIGAVDYITLDLKDAVSSADLIVICLPVISIIKFGRKIIPFLKKGAIITDVGSTKKGIVKNLTSILPDNVYFVGAHPLAGSNESGIEFARQDLFDNSRCIITPVKSTNKEACEIVESMWEKIGVRVNYLSPVEHDRLIASTSHLPHILAVSIVNTVLENNINKIKSMIATGFKDTTRIASSNPVLWRDICFTNRINIINSIENFEKHLVKIKKAIKEKEPKILLNLFESAKIKREKI